jgi:alkyldihydroxyacetonephosphate synthase
MPHFKNWAIEKVGIDLNRKTEIQKDMEVHAPTFNHEFLAELGDNGVSRRSFMKWERIQHSHGETLKEVYALRHGSFKRVVDVVVYPDTHEQVEVSFIFTKHFISHLSLYIL